MYRNQGNWKMQAEQRAQPATAYARAGNGPQSNGNIVLEPARQEHARPANGKASEAGEDKTPHLTVKAKGRNGFVGSAWRNEGKFGPYISVAVNEDVPAGSTLYLQPRKDCPKVLG